MTPILVTGGHGFIGRHVVRSLLRNGYVVRVVDINPADPEPGYEFVQGDLADPNVALPSFRGVSLCIHLASLVTGIGGFSRYPADILDANARVTSSTFKAALENRLDYIIYVSSSCVYDCTQAYPVREADLLAAPAPPAGYQFSKLLGEAYCKAYQSQHRLNYTIVRPFNVYGPGETPGRYPGESHVIPDLVTKILDGQNPLEIFGDGLQTRSFTHVDDIARAFVNILQTPAARNTDFNVGAAQDISVLALAALLWKICRGSEPLRVRHLPPFPFDVRRRAVDIAKAREVLGWEPTVRLSDGLEQVVNWIREWRAQPRRPKVADKRVRS